MVASVGVIGAGTLGCGIGMNFLNEGIPVTLLGQAGLLLDEARRPGKWIARW